MYFNKDEVEHVKQSLAAMIKCSVKHDHLIKNTAKLARIVPFLNENVGGIICDKLSSLIRSYDATIHQCQEELARARL